MIKFEHLQIQNFRGIKQLSLRLEGKSWVIHGKNGSGKSGVVDAIEFAISGTIGRLSGEGRGEVSIKEHSPHVDFKDSPGDAFVTLELSNGSDLSVKITRNCSNPSKVILDPSNADTIALVRNLPFKNEVVLSRREILKYVLTEPGKRSKEVQTLLKIEKIEDLRSSLQTLKNKTAKNVNNTKIEFERVKAKLKSLLGLEEMNETNAVFTINKKRSALGLSALENLNAETKVYINNQFQPKNAISVDKKKILTLLGTLDELIADSSGTYKTIIESYRSKHEELNRKQNGKTQLRKLAFYQSARKLIDGDECPLCGRDWDRAELEEILKNKEDEILGVKEIKSQLDIQIEAAIIHFEHIKLEAANLLGSLPDSYNVANTRELMNVFANAKKAVSENPSDFLSQVADIQTRLETIREGYSSEANTIREDVAKTPEKSAEDSARAFLILCQERLSEYWESKRRLEFHIEKNEQVRNIMEKYTEVVETKLNNLYTEIESDFSTFYRTVNSDDEAKFEAELCAEKAALGLKVDFYNRGKFPPVAYHSEGHQDGMGLCLYLALMTKILGKNFSVAVLDDVLMSVDSDHRKSFCKLLKDRFPDTQFVITTHDEFWKRQMITESLVKHKNALSFKNWTVDTGPTVWDEKDSWEEIQTALDNDDVPSAAHKLRRFLEYIMDTISIRITAKIQRNPSGDHDLGELLSGATSRFGELLEKAKGAARSWGSSDLETSLDSEKKRFDQILARANREAWSINSMVHFNSWSDMGVRDFKQVVVAYRELVDSFSCSSCHTLLHVIPPKGSTESMKCDCNSRNYNLCKKA